MTHIRLLLVLFCVGVAAYAAPSASAGAHVYWWQSNMPANSPVRDAWGPHNHTYNELYFGPSAGWRSEVWEVTPAGYRHFDKWCYGNCFNAHPGYYYDYSFCANRDGYGQTHFVNECYDEW